MYGSLHYISQRVHNTTPQTKDQLPTYSSFGRTYLNHTQTTPNSLCFTYIFQKHAPQYCIKQTFLLKIQSLQQVAASIHAMIKHATKSLEIKWRLKTAGLITDFIF